MEERGPGHKIPRLAQKDFQVKAGEGVEVAGLRTRGASQMLGEEQEVPANLE